MAKAAKSRSKSGTRRKRKTRKKRPVRPLRLAGYVLVRATAVLIVLTLFMVLLYAVVNPPITQTIWAEKRRLGSVERSWVPADEMAPVMLRSAVAAEDANFCLHWGFDVVAIRSAMEAGGGRGASTITQQVVKNVFLWQGRSWIRKAMEAAITPAVEAVWSKRRILEVYLNVAEMGEGVFGAEAAARQHFGVGAAELSPRQAALLAAILPSPKTRSAGKPSTRVQRRAAQIIDGAATIRADGRAACFED